MEQNSEMIPFLIISKGGDASSLYLKALCLAREGKINEAEEVIKDAEASLLEAHKIQTDLIFKEANGDKCEVGVLMIHAQDHLMNAMLLKEMSLHMIEMYKRLAV